jgi:glycosyltransferase involved in cell wall biosynthesis
MLRVAIVGIRGIPNNYGGFETLAEYLVEYLAKDFSLTVYCSSVDMPDKLKQYNGAILKYIPVSSHGFWGIIYDSICLLQATRKNDRILILGFGAGLMVPFTGKAKRKLILNIGGLDWKRSKWSLPAKKVIKYAESLLMKNCRTIIADNKGIQNYILQNYQKQSDLIAYGGDQSKRIAVTSSSIQKYSFLSQPYCFSVARIQPDNNIDLILQAFQQVQSIPIVFVGNWKNSDYGIKIKEQYSGQNNIILLDAIYDRNELDVVRSNCTIYIHGHSAGGTNPSLVEAMCLGLPVFAFASVYNQFTTEQKALFFEDKKELIQLINNYTSLDLFSVASDLKQIASEKYTWKLIAQQYQRVFDRAV